VLTPPPLLPLSSAPSGPDAAYFFDRCLIYSRASQSVLRASLPYLGWSRGRRVYDGIPAFLAIRPSAAEKISREPDAHSWVPYYSLISLSFTQAVGFICVLFVAALDPAPQHVHRRCNLQQFLLRVGAHCRVRYRYSKPVRLFAQLLNYRWSRLYLRFLCRSHKQ